MAAFFPPTSSYLGLFISDEDLLALANDDVNFWVRRTANDVARSSEAVRVVKHKPLARPPLPPRLANSQAYPRAQLRRPPLRMRRISDVGATETRPDKVGLCSLSPTEAKGEFFFKRGQATAVPPTAPLDSYSCPPSPVLIPLARPRTASPSTSSPSSAATLWDLHAPHPATIPLPASSHSPPALVHPGHSPQLFFGPSYLVDSPLSMSSASSYSSSHSLASPPHPRLRRASDIFPHLVDVDSSAAGRDEHDLISLDGFFPPPRPAHFVGTRSSSLRKNHVRHPAEYIGAIPVEAVPHPVRHEHWQLESWVEDQLERAVKGGPRALW
ncbi:hypothetical protein JCM8097_005295 [Rhodosporidiobolus ruineniae]